MECSLASEARCAMLGRVEPHTQDSGEVSERVDFDRVYESMVQYVWTVVCRMGVPRSDAEDVVQEVFVTVYRHLGDFEGRAQTRSNRIGVAPDNFGDIMQGHLFEFREHEDDSLSVIQLG